MANTTAQTSTSQQQNITLQAGKTTEILVAAGQNVVTSSTIDGAVQNADGSLSIKFANGATLVIKNFAETVAQGPAPTLTTEGGKTVDLASLVGAPATTKQAANKAGEDFMPTLTDGTPVAEAKTQKAADGETINAPKAGQDVVVTLEAGEVYNFGFAMNEPVSVKNDGQQLVITFKNGGEIIIPNFGAFKNSTNAPQITMKDGAKLAASDFGDMLATATQLNQTEPAAGDAGGGAARGGFGFQSSFGSTPFQSLNPIGPINPTQLRYDVTDNRPQPILDQPEAPVANLTVSDSQVYEDNSVALNVSSTPATPTEQVTITISGILPGWTVDTSVSGGTYDAATGTWTLTAPVGQAITTGPIVRPPVNSDADMPNLSVNLSVTDTATGLTSTLTGTINVVTDAVIDAPSVNAQDVTGTEDTDIPLDITVSRGGDTLDASEILSNVTIAGVPAGFTLSAGSFDAGTGLWTLTPAQLVGLTMKAPANYSDLSGSIVLTVSVTDTETNLSGGEFDTSNNTATATDTMVVKITPVADEPDLAVSLSATGGVIDEDTSVKMFIQSALKDTDGSEQLTVVVSGIPAGWSVADSLAAGWVYNGGSNTWTMTLPAGVTSFSGELTLTPPVNSDADLNGILVTATATELANGVTASKSQTVDIIVDAVIDAPTLAAPDTITAAEDTSFDLNLNITRGGDTLDGSEVLTILIAGVPAGATLSAGTNLGGGVWSLTLNQVAGLKLTPAKNFNGKFDLTVTVTDTETSLSGLEPDLSDNTATLTDTIAITITPESDDPALIVGDKQTKEDTSVQLPLTATLAAGSSATDYMVITISGIQPGWGVNTTASGGTYDAATGTWTRTVAAGQNYTGGPTFTPPVDSDADMTGLVVTVKQYDAANNVLGSTTDTASIIVDAVIDAPVLNASNASGAEDTAIALNISATKGGDSTDGSEVLSNITISGVPAGATLSAGTNLGGGVWSLTSAQLTGLKLIPAKNYNGTFNLTVSVTDTETNLSGTEFDTTDNTATVTRNLTVNVTPVGDDPALVVGDKQTKEDTSVQLPLTATLAAGSSATDYMVITISGIKAGWGVDTTASGGTYNAATGTWTRTVAAGQNYTGGPTFTPPADSDADMTGLVVTVRQFDVANTLLGTTTGSASIIVDAVIDAPVLNASNASGAEDTAIAINISVGKGGDSADGSEVLSNITISGVPAGATLSAGTNLGGGVWSLTSAQLVGLKLTPAVNYNGSFNLTVSVTDTETNLSGAEFDTTDNTATVTRNLTVNVTPVGDDPSLVVGDKQTKEDTSVQLPLTATLSPGSAPTEYLVITISGIKAGWGVDTTASGGTYNAATGTWTRTVAAGQNYTGGPTFTPPADSDADMTGLVVTVRQFDAANNVLGSATDTASIIVDAVIDGPSLNVSNSNGGVNTAVALNISVGKGGDATDGSEVLSNITISGVPAGATLSAGTNLGGGVWSLTSAQLVGLKLTPAAGYEGNFNLTVSVTDTETNLSGVEFDLTDNAATVTRTLNVNINTDDVPTIVNPADKTVDETNLTPGPVGVTGTISANFFSDGPGVIAGNGTFTFGGSAKGGQLTSNGVAVNVALVGDTYVGTAGGKQIFTLKVLANGSYDFKLTGVLDHADTTNPNDAINLTFGIKATDADGDTVSTTLTVKVLDDGVTANDDFNTKFVGDVASGNVVTGLNGGANAKDDLSEDVTNVVSRVLFGAKIVDVPSTGFATIDGDYGTLKIFADGSYTYTLFAGVAALGDIHDEFIYVLRDGDGDTDNALLVFDVPKASPPTLTVNDEMIKEDGQGQLDVTATLTDPTEQLTVTISGFTAGWTVDTTTSGGTYNAATGTWTITLPTGQNFSGGPIVKPPANSDADLNDLVVTATSRTSTGATASVNATLDVIVDAVIDAPTLNVSNATGEEDQAIALNISAGRGGDTADGSEVLSNITISGVPAGATLSAGTNLGGGVWSLTSAQLTGLKLNPPAGFDGTFNLTVSVTDTETNLSGLEYDLTDNSATVTKTLTVNVTPDDTPTIAKPGDKDVDETDLKTGPDTVSGTVTANFFTDGPGTFAATGTGTFTFGGSVKNGALTSNGVPVVITLVGNKYVGTAGGKEIFTLQINSNGSYTFILKDQLDHANVTDPNDVMTLNFGITATDKDGDTAATTIGIRVFDDGPKAFNDTGNIVIAENGTGSATGNVITGLNGGAGAADSLSQDDPNTITQIGFNGNIVNIPSGSFATIAGNFGTLKIFSDGSYTYTLDPAKTSSGQSTDSFLYTLIDADGDTSTATLTLNGLGSTFKVGENVNDTTGSTTPYEVGTGTGTITGRAGNDILVGDVGGTRQVVGNKDYNVVLVLDISGSMGLKTDPASKYSLLMNAVKNLMQDFSNYEGGEVRVHIVPFSTSVFPMGTFDVSTVAGFNAAIAYINNMSAGGGFTNYEAGMQAAIAWLQGQNVAYGKPITGAETYSYFISDGEPNRFVNDATNTVVTGTEAQSMAQITGADGTNEIAILKSLSTEVIGVGIDITSKIANIAMIDSDGNALNISDPNDLTKALASASPITQFNGVGADNIVAGDGNDMIFGDSLYTDTLATAKGIALPAGSGWEVFAKLEAGLSAVSPNWTRADTLDYIRNNASSLARESVNGSNTRTGGNDRLEGGLGDDIIFGQEGDDLIIGGMGNDVLSGGSGMDTFRINSVSEGVDQIVDFSVSQGDILDISNIIAGYDPLTDSLSDFVKVVNSGGNSIVQVDATGTGTAYQTVAILQGVTVDLDTLSQSGNLIA